MPAKKKPSPVMGFVIDYLKKRRGASFADVRDAAAKKRLKLYPIVYGRAQALLGIVKSAPRGSGKAARLKAAKAVLRPAARGRGRPRATTSPQMESLQGIISAVRESQAEKERFRSVLTKIQTLLQDAMA